MAAKAGTGATKQVDPICGRKLVSGVNRVISTEYKNRKYFFCSPGCLAAFHRRTEKFRLRELIQSGALFLNGKVRWGMA